MDFHWESVVHAVTFLILVYGARDVWSKNGEFPRSDDFERVVNLLHSDQPRPLYVVFGVGGVFYRTAATKDLQPVWNETQSLFVPCCFSHGEFK